MKSDNITPEQGKELIALATSTIAQKLKLESQGPDEEILVHPAEAYFSIIAEPSGDYFGFVTPK